MSNALVVLLSTTPSIICAGSACWLAVHGKPAWGWFLFAAVLIAGATTVKITA